MIDYNETNLEKIRRVADTLQGTCGSLDDALQEEFGEDVDVGDFEIRLLHELDDLTMQCESCGWWCETGELNDDQICADCV